MYVVHPLLSILSNRLKIDDKNPKVPMIFLLSPKRMFLSTENYINAPVMSAWATTIAEMLQILQTGKSIQQEPMPSSRKAVLVEQAMAAVQFEKRIIEAALSRASHNSVSIIF
jgi:hypothetical protein